MREKLLGHESRARPEGLPSGRAGICVGLALQFLIALAVIAAALGNPFHAAVGVGRFVGVVLIDAGVHARLAGVFLGVFRIHGGRENGVSGRRRRRRGFLLRLGLGLFSRCWRGSRGSG